MKKTVEALQQALDESRQQYEALVVEHLEMQKSANELVSAQVQMQSVLNNASEGIIMFSPDDTVLSFNRAAERIFSYTETEVLYIKLDPLFNLSDAQSVPMLIREYCATHAFTEMIDDPLVAVRPSGEEVPLRVAMSEVNSCDMVLFDDDSELDQDVVEAGYDLFLCIVHDLTDDIRIKDKLKSQQQALEHANQIKDHLIANVSHELLTPLNGILPLTELLLDEGLTSDQHNYIKIIQDSSYALKRIVSSILQFSQAQQHISKSSSQGTMVSEIEQQLENTYRQRLDEKGLDMTFVRDKIPDVVHLDYHRVMGVLDRLLDNAIKFTQQGEIVLRMSLCEACLAFSLKDTGSGIDSSRLPSIFQSFVQGDGSKTRAYGGVGLGLAIAEQFVKEMGGRIWGESQLGSGSCFHFEIPLENVETEKMTIDEAVFSELQALLGAAFSDVVQGYVDETSDRLDKLGSLLEDEAAVRGVLNDISAGSHQMGAIKMANLCEDLNHHMVGLSLVALQAKLVDIKAAFSQVKHDLVPRCKRG